MRLIRFVPGSLLFLALCGSAAFGQAQRTFVSGSGSDSNPCSRTLPCRTFTQAISQTNAGGEVVVLDSAGYGAFTINKAVSITSPQGVYAGITVFSGDGIDINAGNTDVIILRGLTINAQGGSNGLVFNSGGAVDIDSCVVRGFSSGYGIFFGAAGTLQVKDTVITDCAVGISTRPSSGTVHATIDHVIIDGGGYGIDIGALASGTSAALIRDSSVSGASTVGMQTQPVGGSATATMDVERCVISYGSTGIFSYQGSGGIAQTSISNCLISHNTSGFGIVMGTTMYSRGNNTIIDNGSNSGSLTPLPAQ
jgi:hypothetical protein